ncbi:valine--tRNA ligase-like [Scylla paramamosain]|uniref:valine--tRNA ligase-like n=1 Tax=Scylla paramamosain TaxID=85552 RepID=UPI0030828A8C
MIFDQLWHLGASLDWDTCVYHGCSERLALTEAFVCPYDAGLVYRKEALVNWCCSLQSAISDIEVDRLHLTGPTELAVPGYSKPVNLEKMYDHLQTGRLRGVRRPSSAPHVLRQCLGTLPSRCTPRTPATPTCTPNACFTHCGGRPYL